MKFGLLFEDVIITLISVLCSSLKLISRIIESITLLLFELIMFIRTMIKFIFGIPIETGRMLKLIFSEFCYLFRHRHRWVNQISTIQYEIDKNEWTKMMIRIILDVSFHCILIEVKNPTTIAMICLLWLWYSNDYFNHRVKSHTFSEIHVEDEEEYPANLALIEIDDTRTRCQMQINKQRSVHGLVSKIMLIGLILIINTMMNMEGSYFFELTINWLDYIFSVEQCIESHEFMPGVTSSIHQKLDTGISDSIPIIFENYKIVFTICVLFIISLIELLLSRAIHSRSLSFRISELYHQLGLNNGYDRTMVNTLFKSLERCRQINGNNYQNCRELEKKYIKEHNKLLVFRIHGFIRTIAISLPIMLITSYFMYKGYSIGFLRFFIGLNLLIFAPITIENDFRTFLDNLQDILHMIGMFLICFVPPIHSVTGIQKMINMFLYAYLFMSIDHQNDASFQYRVNTELKLLRNSLEIWALYWVDFRHVSMTEMFEDK
jgi:hypothetical protein